MAFSEADDSVVTPPPDERARRDVEPGAAAAAVSASRSTRTAQTLSPGSGETRRAESRQRVDSPPGGSAAVGAAASPVPARVAAAALAAVEPAPGAEVAAAAAAAAARSPASAVLIGEDIVPGVYGEEDEDLATFDRNARAHQSVGLENNSLPAELFDAYVELMLKPMFAASGSTRTGKQRSPPSGDKERTEPRQRRSSPPTTSAFDHGAALGLPRPAAAVVEPTPDAQAAAAAVVVKPAPAARRPVPPLDLNIEIGEDIIPF